MNRDGVRSRLQDAKALQEFQAFERFQMQQEGLRRRLGSPVGRSPPLTVSLVAPEEDYWKTQSCLVVKSPKNSKLPGIVSPKVKINASNIKTALSGHSTASGTRSSLSLHRYASSVPLPIEDNYQYAFPDPQNLPSFNPFLRPKARNHFFPTSLFDLDNTDYSLWQYPLSAFARWGLISGEWTWKPCDILQFDSNTALFTVKWKESDMQKQVSRLNIKLYGEEDGVVLKRLAQASQRRDLLEAALRYETRLNLTAQRFPDIIMPPTALTKILSYLQGVLTPLNYDRVCEEIHTQHRLNIINFVFEVEHFISKAKLIAR